MKIFETKISLRFLLWKHILKYVINPVLPGKEGKIVFEFTW